MTFRENMARTKEMMLSLWRQGVHEIGAAFFGPGTVAQAPEYGMPHTKMAIEVADAQRTDGPEAAKEHGSILGDRIARAEQARDVREPEPPSIERE